MGNYSSLKDIVIDAGKRGTNILSFRSSRGKLRYDQTEEVRGVPGGRRAMLDNTTFLEAYNCDSAPMPKPSWAVRARKQIYRADYVKCHFVHYSTITEGLLRTYSENEDWHRHYHEENHETSERETDDENEATMIHAKLTDSPQTSHWKSRCHYQYEKKYKGCWIGFPWPNGTVVEGNGGHREDGIEYNCFENVKVKSYWAPRLREALARRPTTTTG